MSLLLVSTLLVVIFAGQRGGGTVSTLLVVIFAGQRGGGTVSADLRLTVANTTDAVVRLNEYGSLRYVAPAHFRNFSRILFWTPAYGHVDHWSWWFNRMNVRDACPDLPCDFTSDQSRLNDSDAVLFMTYSNNFDLRGDVRAQLPPHRHQWQRWVHFALEPPLLRRDQENLRPLAGLFNWTMNYRRDADVYAPFARLVLNKLPAEKMTASLDHDFSRNKTKTVAWLASHCPTDGRREDFVAELQKHLEVDVYGRCGPLRCDPPQSESCYRKIGHDYLFYLAFENLLCEHYVTEKFFRALAMDLVPVVLGGADYASYAPAGSYLDALDFDGPEALAERMTFLAENPREYNRFFDWKRGYSARVVQSGHYVCELCMKLLDPDVPDKTYEDLDEWWHGGGRCREWEPK